jgi:hypothetical protein
MVRDVILDVKYEGWVDNIVSNIVYATVVDALKKDEVDASTISMSFAVGELSEDDRANIQVGSTFTFCVSHLTPLHGGEPKYSYDVKLIYRDEVK